jgi:hypothetical protein
LENTIKRQVCDRGEKGKREWREKEKEREKENESVSDKGVVKG